MNAYEFTFLGVALRALGSGALHWPDRALLCVSDLHMGRSGRHAGRGAPRLPPYETRDTLMRLETDLAHTGARMVICLGDSFDDATAADTLREDEALWIARLQAGRRWVWIEGNHDPGPMGLGGAHMADLSLPPLIFRHIARTGEKGEISGHYHPKATVRSRGRVITRPAFLLDENRLILPAYGTYTGGLRSEDPALAGLMSAQALAILTGPVPRAIPMPR